ncbi:pimeloyl-ACP methyl ester carboxylesterase [Nocardioides albertanoniae]|uniref:Pimeloyl-ACP methyl ester carboxylesterase n=1 Tax=Nocardioides albertanoniae TaxID=1175486 RepID=A0A543A2T7_9ACTN|nr:alpha/beta fold hydrolase [Nocardioides albertanoniae]TQL66897.1 pimeloyl-ACP methyl ester carboxylesterase [Nocardioides albertanoniae]
MTELSRRLVETTDGLRLAVYEQGPADAETVVLVHGYPDNHSVWDGAAAALAARFHVVAYDVRGTGESEAPDSTAGYRLAQLSDDFRSVIDAVSPDAPVHVAAHDWGSIQTWESVTSPSLSSRISSYTSISGPDLGMATTWLRERGHARSSLRQLAHSWYVFAFQLPLLPEAMVRSGVLSRFVGGRPRPERDQVNGVELYRANFLGKLVRPEPRSTDVPVQVLAPRDDAYVTVPLQTEAPKAYASSLVTKAIDGGHWVVEKSPDLVADEIAAFIEGAGAR